MREFFNRRIVEPLKAQLRQGSSPEALAKSLAWGAAVGICPVWGTSTWMAGFSGLAFKLNHVALQAANYLVYPLQLALIVPFLLAGDKLFGVEASLYNLEAFRATYALGFGVFLKTYGYALLRAAAVWAIVTPLPAWLLMRALLPILRRIRT